MKKPQSVTDAVERYAQLLKVCGHPLRLQILFAIERGENACVKELWRCLKQSQPVVSQHLAVLKEQHIVDAKTEKNKRIYYIINPFVREVMKTLLTDDALKELPSA